VKSILILLAALFCTNAMAASSACEVFVVTNGQGGANFGYNVFTSCDGKKISETPITSGISEAYTAGLQTLLLQGYNVFSCTMETSAEGNNSVPGTYDCLLIK
jgi:opacity protein-like surface antigen